MIVYDIKHRLIFFKILITSLTILITSEVMKSQDLIEKSDSITLTGRVLDNEDYKPMFGVNVIIYGTVVGTLTNFEGEYSLTFHSSLLSENRKILFRYINYCDKLINIQDNIDSDVLIILEYEEVELSDPVLARPDLYKDIFPHLFKDKFQTDTVPKKK